MVPTVMVPEEVEAQGQSEERPRQAVRREVAAQELRLQLLVRLYSTVVAVVAVDGVERLIRQVVREELAGAVLVLMVPLLPQTEPQEQLIQVGAEEESAEEQYQIVVLEVPVVPVLSLLLRQHPQA